jgi:hypothetical protein
MADERPLEDVAAKLDDVSERLDEIKSAADEDEGFSEESEEALDDIRKDVRRDTSLTCRASPPESTCLLIESGLRTSDEVPQRVGATTAAAAVWISPATARG